MPHKYQYYILLDDDIEFVQGGYKEFETEVLKVKPDLAVPVYYTRGAFAKYSKMTPFPYSELLEFDCCFICLDRELFYDRRLLPYHTDYYSIPAYNNSFYPSIWFWIMLFEYYCKNIICINKIQIVNTSHEAEYNYKTCTHDGVLRLARMKYPNLSNRYFNQLLLLKLYNMVSKIRYDCSHSYRFHEIIRRRVLKIQDPIQFRRISWLLFKHKKYRWLAKYLLYKTVYSIAGERNIHHSKLHPHRSRYDNLYKYRLYEVIRRRVLKINDPNQFNKISRLLFKHKKYKWLIKYSLYKRVYRIYSIARKLKTLMPNMPNINLRKKYIFCYACAIGFCRDFKLNLRIFLHSRFQ